MRGGAQSLGLAAHLLVLRWSLVVPAEQVQEAVSEQHGHLGDHLDTSSTGLPPRGLHAHDDVTEEIARVLAVLALALGKRQDVRRAVFLSINSVEDCDSSVARQQDRYLAVAHSKRLEHGAHAPFDRRPRHPGVRTSLDGDPDARGERSSLSSRLRHGRDCAICVGRAPAGRPTKSETVQKPFALVPALDAAETIGAVVDDLRATLGVPVIVVDDGSRDATSDAARARGAEVVRHERNRGKGAAIVSGLTEAARRGFDTAITVDADGQHPGISARAVLDAQADRRAIVLGVRDLGQDGAPASNRFGNAVSNFFLSFFAQTPLSDTQCGLRRYPVEETLALGVRSRGYAFEAEVILRAIAAGLPIIEIPVAVVYAAEALRRTHFRNMRDPARIVAAVARTVLELRLGAS